MPLNYGGEKSYMNMRKKLCAISAALVMTVTGCASDKTDPATSGDVTKEENTTVAEGTEPTVDSSLKVEMPVKEDLKETYEDGTAKPAPIDPNLYDVVKQKVRDELFASIMDTCRSYATAEGDAEYGTPPRVFFISYTEKAVPNSEGIITSEDLVERYKYENEKLEPVEKGADEGVDLVRSGMYWNIGHISVTVDVQAATIDYSFNVGPLYGSGYQFEIIVDEQGIRIGQGRMQWIS